MANINLNIFYLIMQWKSHGRKKNQNFIIKKKYNVYNISIHIKYKWCMLMNWIKDDAAIYFTYQPLAVTSWGWLADYMKVKTWVTHCSLLFLINSILSNFSYYLL